MSTTTTWPLRIRLCALPPSPNSKLCWQERRRAVKPLVDSVVLQARSVGLARPLQRARVVATMVHERRPLRDWDNCVSSLKEIIDGLRTGGLIVDDDPEHIELAVVQVLGRERGVLLEIWPAEDNGPGGQPTHPTGPRTQLGVYFPTVAAWTSWFSAADALTPGLPSRLLTVTCCGHHEGRTVFFQSPSGWLDARVIDQLVGLARPTRARRRGRRRGGSQQCIGRGTIIAGIK